jgi:hypothetical protein
MSRARLTYPELKKRLERLAASLLPPDSANGTYTDRDKDLIHAYIVLAHAEIEEFLENLARFVTERARDKSTPPQCTPTISRLIIYKSIRGKEKIETVSSETIASAVAHYENVISGNHGIRADNLFRVFMPLGLTHDDFDAVLMNELDTFGNLRGGIAHTAARLQQGASPSSEKRKVLNILEGLSHLDQKVRALK